MAVTAFWYGKAIQNILGGATEAESRKIDWLSDVIKVMLCTSAYTPNQDTHAFKTDVTNEVTGTGYDAGGKELTGKTLAYDAATNKTTLDGDDVSWPNSTITARYAVVYDATPSLDEDKPLVGYVDFGEDKSTNDGEFKVQWNIDGMYTGTVS